MARLGHIPEDASPVSVSQSGLIRLNGPDAAAVQALAAMAIKQARIAFGRRRARCK